MTFCIGNALFEEKTGDTTEEKTQEERGWGCAQRNIVVTEADYVQPIVIDSVFD